MSSRSPLSVHAQTYDLQVVGDDRSVLDTVLAADLERTYLLGREKELEEIMQGGKGTPNDTDEYAFVHARLLEMEAWSAEARCVVGESTCRGGRCVREKEYERTGSCRASVGLGLPASVASVRNRRAPLAFMLNRACTSSPWAMHNWRLYNNTTAMPGTQSVRHSRWAERDA